MTHCTNSQARWIDPHLAALAPWESSSFWRHGSGVEDRMTPRWLLNKSQKDRSRKIFRNAVFLWKCYSWMRTLWARQTLFRRDRFSWTIISLAENWGAVEYSKYPAPISRDAQETLVRRLDNHEPEFRGEPSRLGSSCSSWEAIGWIEELI